MRSARRHRTTMINWMATTTEPWGIVLENLFFLSYSWDYLFPDCV